MDKTVKEWWDHVQSLERSGKPYVKIGSGGKKLVVSFGDFNGWFTYKNTFLHYKHSRGEDVDLLFIRDKGKCWYLGGLHGISNCLQETITFLKQTFNEYETVATTGFSMGGYASILFGSLLNVNAAIAFWPQIDLDYCIDQIQLLMDKRKVKGEKPTHHQLDFHGSLTNIRDVYTGGYKHFSNISNILTNDCKYFVGHQPGPGGMCEILHGKYQIDLIANHPSIQTTDADRYETCNYLDSIFY